MPAAIQPTSNLRLLRNVGIKDYSNELIFKTVTDQQTFFNGRVQQAFDDFQYVRHGGAVVVPLPYEQTLQCDYLDFYNANFGNKRFYAFINKKEYVNDASTMITFEIDSYQTYMFDIVYSKNYIARGLVVDDYVQWVFNNLYTEGIEYGNSYRVVNTDSYYFTNFVYLICSTINFGADFGSSNEPAVYSSLGGVFDGLPSAMDYYVAGEGLGANVYNMTGLMTYLSAYPWISQGIQSITAIPREMLGDSHRTVHVNNAQGGYVWQLNSGYTSKSVMHSFSWVDKFPSYEHRKLYAYPYSFIEMTLYNGNTFSIRPELINGTGFNIKFEMVITGEVRMIAWIDNYNGGEYLDASLPFSSFPQLPVLKDNYILYQAQNARTFALNNQLAQQNIDYTNLFAHQDMLWNLGDTGVNIASSLASMNLGGILMSGYKGAKNDFYIQRSQSESIRSIENSVRAQNARISDAQTISPTVQGQSGGDAWNMSKGIFGVTLKYKTILAEFASRLDDYFTRYGYTINKIDYLDYHLFTHKTFDYVQTCGCHINGNMPTEDAETIQKMFDAGVTMWHSYPIGIYDGNEVST